MSDDRYCSVLVTSSHFVSGDDYIYNLLNNVGLIFKWCRKRAMRLRSALCASATLSGFLVSAFCPASHDAWDLRCRYPASTLAAWVIVFW